MPKRTGRRNKPETSTPAKSVKPLRGRNIMLHGSKRTSMRLEPSMWVALEEIAAREGMSLNDLCSRIDDRLSEQATQRTDDSEEAEVTLTSGVRVFIFAYYRVAATEEGHIRAGHGLGDPFVGTPFNKKTDDGGAAPKDDPTPTSDLSSGGSSQTKASDAAAAA